jgi:hypothetical protein
MPKKLLKKLEEVDYNRDLEITQKEWKRQKKQNEHRDSRSLAALEHIDEPTYRDNKEKKA